MHIKINDIKSLDITILGSKSLSLKLNGIKAVETRKYYEEFNKTFYTKTILQLKFEGVNAYSIKLGDSLKINKQTYTVNEIISGRIDEYILIDQTLNKSTKYILPLLVPKNTFAVNYLFNASLYNTYLYCDKYPELCNNKFLFLKYRFLDHAVYKEFESIITTQKNFVKIDDSEQNFTTFILDISEEFNSTMYYFLLGKYHVISEEHEHKILEFFLPTKNSNDYKPIYNEVSRVLTRSKEYLKKLENKLDMKIPDGIGLDSKPTREQETLKLL